MKIRLFLLALICAATLCACHHNEAEEHEHHGGEPITIYSEHYEIYAETTPLIKGEKCKILAHITKLYNFKPLDSTRVTMTIQLENKTIEGTIQNPKEAGKYLFEFTPSQSGCGHLEFAIQRGDTVERIHEHIHIYASEEEYEKGVHSHEGHNHSHEGHNHEGHNHSHDEHSHEGHSHSHEGHSHSHEEAGSNSNEITFTKEQSWKIDFATEELQPMEFGQLIKTTAQVLPSAGDQRVVTAKASGIVVFANPNLVEGCQVSAGQRLFSIESSGMADNNMSVRFQEASVNYNVAKQEYERKKVLAADKIVSESELARAKAEMDNAAAVYNNLKGNFSRNGQSLSSPIGGYLTSIAVQNGSYVEAGQTVATVSQNRDLYIRAEVAPRYYQSLGHILSASFSRPNDDRVYSIDSLGGGLVSYGKSADANNPLIPVTFRFRNSMNLLSGSFVKLYIRTANDEKVLTIPNTGIAEEMGTHCVFVQITPEKFEKRIVTLGSTDGFRTVITSGVKAGERVVSKGAIMVKMAQGAGALDPHAGHMH